MPRNFHRRVETLVPIEEKELKEKLKEILEIQLKDTAKARFLKADGTYERPKVRDFNSQEYFEKWVREYSL
jgi:polyphosphate kinase